MMQEDADGAKPRPAKVAVYLTWKTGDNETYYRVTFDEDERTDPGTFRIERMHRDYIDQVSWRPVEQAALLNGERRITWEYRTLPAVVMSELVRRTIDWGKRLHDYVRDTKVVPPPRSELNMLPPDWDRTAGLLVINLGTFEPAP